MQGTSFNAGRVQCPYYRWDNGMTMISCEGLLPDTALQNVFRDKDSFRVQMKQFCQSRTYWSCEICAALNRAYKEQEDDG